MGTNLEAVQRHVFLSTKPAQAGEKWLARIVVAVFGLGFFGSLPFIRSPMMPVPPFVPGYEAALCINYTVTAILLFSQFARLRSRGLLTLAAGYLFVSMMVIPHALSFPGVFRAGGLIGSGPLTTAWLYMFWHGGFPVLVLTYALIVRRPSDVLQGSASRAITWAVVGVTISAVSLTILATAGHRMLPEIFVDGDHSLHVTNGVSSVLWLLGLGALLTLRARALPTVLELWLMVAMVAWILDITCSAALSAHRSDVGFYLGRLYGLLAATFVLGALLFEMSRLYGKVSEALALAEIRNLELARSREEFARVQRFEAIGQLVGGVAHDFNNLLTVITGALDLTLRDPGLPARAHRLLNMSMAAAHRGSELTGQLLTFARKQVMRPEVLNPNQVIAGLETFIARATGERVDVVLDLSPVLWPARLDRAQFETALVNLVLNARDALKGQGRIEIETHNLVLQPEAELDLPAGDYVKITVRDAGSGMTPEVVARAVDPFFTTKEVGKGSGLGLSQVYGFVRAAAGNLRIDSALGRGTRVEMYLPKSIERPLQAKSFDLPPIRAADEDETILVVEDDPDVLNVAVSGLLDLGYAVRTATNAQEALAVLRGDDKIDVLFSDVVMAGRMNGAQLAVEARRLRPGLRVLLTSGYTASALSEDHGLSERLEVLPKPYRREELATKLRLVMGA